MKKILTITLSLLIVASFAQQREAGPSKTKDQISGRCMSVTGAVDINDVVEALLGAGVTYSNVTYQGILSNDPLVASIGGFSGSDCVPLGFNEGIMLSSGFVGNAVGPNVSGSTTGFLGTGGDADLQTLIPGFSVNDATWIEFDFIPEDNNIFIEYVFGSDEYNEWVFSSFNDVFGFFVNGVNIALVPETSDPVTIDNVNNVNNSVYYKNNEFFPGPYDIEADGLTVALTATAAVNAGVTNTIKIGVADAGDTAYDSWVFIKAGSFSTVNPEVPVSNWALYLGILLMITFVVIRFRRMI